MSESLLNEEGFGQCPEPTWEDDAAADYAVFEQEQRDLWEFARLAYPAHQIPCGCQPARRLVCLPCRVRQILGRAMP
jgi:hypothetical protein